MNLWSYNVSCTTLSPSFIKNSKFEEDLIKHITQLKKNIFTSEAYWCSTRVASFELLNTLSFAIIVLIFSLMISFHRNHCPLSLFFHSAFSLDSFIIFFFFLVTHLEFIQNDCFVWCMLMEYENCLFRYAMGKLKNKKSI